MNAQGVLTPFLSKRGMAVTPSDAVSKEFALLLSVQPPWLDVDAAFLADTLTSAPSISKRERTVWLRKRILELFRYQEHPPRWIQSPAWPIGASGPLVFIGQLSIDDQHDSAAVYVFRNPSTGEFHTVVQVA